MPLEDRLKSFVDTTSTALRAGLEEAFAAFAKELEAELERERETTIADARRLAVAEAAQQTAEQVAAAEARARANVEQMLEEARHDEREKAALEIRRVVEAEIDQRYRERIVTTEQRHALAIADLEARVQEAARSSAAAAHVQERQSEMASTARLLESIRGLDGAASLSEVLDALGLAISRETARSAVLVLRGDRLVGWKLSGFGPRDAQPKLIDLGLSEAGVIGLAVGAARAMTTKDGQAGANGPGFAELAPDRMGLAVPVIVGGRVVAVVYADGVGRQADHPVPSGWPEIVEVLARHAARCLEALTAQKAAQASSARIAVPRAAAPASSAGTPVPGAGA